MTGSGPKDLAASLNGRLVERSHQLEVEHQLTLARFGGERLLYRLSQSDFSDRFILKGASLLLLWLGDAVRPTKDIDLLGFGDTSVETLRSIFIALCHIEAPDDGLRFLADTVRAETIRDGQEYGGVRVTLLAMLGGVRIPLQVDVGTGDAVVPPPDTVEYPGLLDLPRARLRAYRPETSIAEKTEAMVRLAIANTRMKDFFDIHRLALVQSFDGDTVGSALAATFDRRRTPLPSEVPVALSDRFGADRQKQVQWNAFIRRVHGTSRPAFSDVIASLRAFLWPALQAAAESKPWPCTWAPGGPWRG